jgi:hypothetical protein
MSQENVEAFKRGIEAYTASRFGYGRALTPRRLSKPRGQGTNAPGGGSHATAKGE